MPKSSCFPLGTSLGPPEDLDSSHLPALHMLPPLREGVLPKNRVQEREETLTPFYSHILPQGLGDLGLPWQLSGKEPTG